MDCEDLVNAEDRKEERVDLRDTSGTGQAETQRRDRDSPSLSTLLHTPVCIHPWRVRQCVLWNICTGRSADCQHHNFWLSFHHLQTE